MILKYYGGYMSLADIQELFHADKNGTNAYDMVEGMKKVGFYAMGFECPLEKFLEENIILPCIAHVTLNQSYSHFVVIYEINKKKKELVIADPANKIMTVNFDIFHSIYSGHLFITYPIKPVIHLEEQTLSLRYLLSLLKSSKSLIWQVGLFSLFILIYAIATSFYGEVMLRGLQSNNKESYFYFLLVVFASMTFLKLTTEFFRNKVFLWIEKKIDITLSMDAFYKVLWLSYSYYHNHTTGDILSRIDSLEDVKHALVSWIVVLLIDIPLLFISFLALYFLSTSISILVLLFFLLQLLILKIFADPLRTEIESCQKCQAELTNVEVESIKSFETVKGISLEHYFQNKLMQEKVSCANQLHHLEKIITWETYGKKLCEEMSTILLLFVGCILVYRGNLTFATLLTIQNLATYFYMPMGELIALDKDFKKAQKAIERMSIFQKKEKMGYLNKLEEGNICFKDLSYAYRLDTEILHHIKLTIEKGEKVLVLGKSGSGKSTLFRLLKRYYEVPRGCIQIGENDINDYENMNEVCYINQTENLYTGSLLENLTLSETIEEKVLQEMIHMCEVDEIAWKDSLGLHRLIEENGFNLSGGERQRIVLARTLLRPFKILIIDEGLNQVDVNLERRILKRIFKKYMDKTIIIISHREENLDLFTRKIRIEEGAIKENVVRRWNT